MFGLEPVVLTRQGWFDAAWERSADESPAMRDDECLYFMPDGTPGCFVGCAMKGGATLDRDAVNEANLYDLVRKGAIVVSDLDSFADAAHFLDGIQFIHDRRPPEEWRAGLWVLAGREGLTIPGERATGATGDLA